MYLALQKTNPEDFCLHLKKRAKMLKEVRDFFLARLVTEVDVPMLSHAAPIDPYIDIIEANCCGTPHYLHSSPEYGMKKLLAQGAPDIFQLSHVFRDNEQGSQHLLEFTLIEWYRLKMSFEDLWEETMDLISLFTGPKKREYLSYEEAFERSLGINPHQADLQTLLNLACEKQLPLYEGAEKKEHLLNLFLERYVEPSFSPNSFTVLYDFPKEESALAKLAKNKKGHPVAKRFEVYYQKKELANGYQELTCPSEQRQRLLENNATRKAQNKKPLPLDESFIQALEKGLPECCGVAVGFDRLILF